MINGSRILLVTVLLVALFVVPNVADCPDVTICCMKGSEQVGGFITGTCWGFPVCNFCKSDAELMRMCKERSGGQALWYKPCPTN